MSQLWRDQIAVFIAPDRVDMVRSKRGLKPVKSPVTTQLIDDNPDGQSAWLLPMQQLEQLLQKASGTEMTVTLSNHFVRYVTLPPQVEITTPEEVQAYADFRMREIYGTRVDRWVISISTWNPLYGAICAAISQELLANLEEIVSRHHVKLKGIEPYFSAVLDLWAKSLNKSKSYVALIESKRFCVALLENGIWKSIRNQRVLYDVADELWAALDQEAVLTGVKEPVELVFLFAPEHSDLRLKDDCGWRIVPLQSEKVLVPAHYPYPLSVMDATKEKTCSA